MSKKKSRQKQKKRKKVTFSGLVDGWREADRKNPEMKGSFRFFGFPIDFRFLESDILDNLFEGIAVFVGFFLLAGLDYLLKFLGIHLVVLKALIELVVGIIFCCGVFYIFFGKKISPKWDEVEKSDFVTSFVLVIAAILFIVYILNFD